MHIRREMAADQLAMVRKLLAGWEKKLRNPAPAQGKTDGMGAPVEDDEPVPDGAMVVETLGNQETVKLRSELMAIASTLEGLAGT